MGITANTEHKKEIHRKAMTPVSEQSNASSGWFQALTESI